jgi:Protein of unknown function (DUF3179)
MLQGCSINPDLGVLSWALWAMAAFLLLITPLPSLAADEVHIDPNAIITLLPKDAIPAIRDSKPLLVPANEVQGVRDTDQVLGVAIGGESRAYPIPLLSWHEIANDAVGGVPLAVTW